MSGHGNVIWRNKLKSNLKYLFGFICICVGLMTALFGEIGVLAWCVYDFINLFKSEYASFSSCLWLVIMYVMRGVCTGLIGIFLMLFGFVVGEITK